ncbi:triple QxxK/R motif-containing protein-like [Tachypleus tridentatus]|uniref:triple QxxK/R motif-containing protein-like n=1 Tax=Tachypleus tridentatus TaxID=6853 RepID=UPI003FD63824
MARNRKDSGGQLPIESYRKQIGKQDYKKAKTELKEARKKAQAKQTTGARYKEVSLMVVALLILVISVYLIFYLFLVRDEAAEKSTDSVS